MIIDLWISPSTHDWCWNEGKLHANWSFVSGSSKVVKWRTQNQKYSPPPQKKICSHFKTSQQSLKLLSSSRSNIYLLLLSHYTPILRWKSAKNCKELDSGVIQSCSNFISSKFSTYYIFIVETCEVWKVRQLK